jgi:hypothetical protein
MHDRTVGAWHRINNVNYDAEQDGPDRSVWTGGPNRSAWTGQPGQDREYRIHGYDSKEQNPIVRRDEAEGGGGRWAGDKSDGTG